MSSSANNAFRLLAKGSTTRPSKPQVSPFFKLPAELRNAIYEEILVENGPVSPWRLNRTSALLSTCRQIRCDCLPMIYQGNVFRQDLTEMSGCKFEMINDQISLIRAGLAYYGCAGPLTVELHVTLRHETWVTRITVEDEGPSFYDSFEEAYQYEKARRIVMEARPAYGDLMGLRWNYLMPELRKYFHPKRRTVTQPASSAPALPPSLEAFRRPVVG